MLIQITASYYAYHFLEWGFHKLGHNKRWGGIIYRVHMAHHHKYHIGNLLQEGEYEGASGEMVFIPCLMVVWLCVWWFMNDIFSLFVVTTSILLFISNVIHQEIHRRDSWLEQNEVTREWFLERRKFHVIHHHKPQYNMSLGGISYIADEIMETLRHPIDFA